MNQSNDSSSDDKTENFAHVPQAYGFRTLARTKPEIYSNFFAIADEIMRADGTLTDSQRELVGSYVSKISNCTYCCDSHIAVASALGETQAATQIDGPSDKMKALFDLAQKIVQHTNAITRSDIDEVIDAGWPEAAAEEVIHIAAFFGFANRIVTGYGFVGTPEGFAQSAKFLAKSYRLVTEQKLSQS